MQKLRTKTIGVSFPFDVITEIEKITPKLGVKTPTDACRKMILAYLKFSGANIPDARFARLKREPLSEKKKQRLRENIKRANEVRLQKKLSLKQAPDPHIRRSKNTQKSTRSAA